MNFSIEDVVRILAATPNILVAWLSNLPEAWVTANDGKDTWSAYDIVGHLIHGEKTDWIPRAQIILSNRDNREFEPFDRFAMFEESKGKSLQDLLDEFRELREASLIALNSLGITISDLDRTGLHPSLGVVTLSELLATWAVHDLSHLSQIAQVLGRQYSGEVGPWLAFLGITDE